MRKFCAYLNFSRDFRILFPMSLLGHINPTRRFGKPNAKMDLKIDFTLKFNFYR